MAMTITFTRRAVTLAQLSLVIALPAAQPHAPGSPEAERERWNHVFAQSPPNIRTDANEFLVRVAGELQPGQALDIGMGFGRNALFLARKGWTVTGLDISDVGVDLARQQAAKEKLALTALCQDATTFDYGRNRWDLIALIYMGSFAKDLADRLTDALKPGGVLVIEHFWKGPNQRLGYESKVVPTWYPRLEVLRYAEEVSNPDYDAQHKGRVVRFLARKPVPTRPDAAGPP